MIRRYNISDTDFISHFEQLLVQDVNQQEQIQRTVREIIADVRARGDEALLDYTRKFDQVNAQTVDGLSFDQGQLAETFENLEPIIKEALTTSAGRVKDYHERQLANLGSSWNYEDSEGNKLGQAVRPMESVGIYAPGGKACYPSTVIMTAIPASVAGVKQLTLVVPTPNGEVNKTLLAAAHLAGINRVYTIGGAQAIAALAYGTETISSVNKIVGPGNIYVATAKKQVFGDVGIDMVAGPSEVTIVADKHARPDWLVMDLFAQAEHDELAQSILISDDQQLLDEVAESLSVQLSKMSRRSIIHKSLTDRGALIKVDDLEQAVQLVNQIAPEHLQLIFEGAEQLLPKVQSAGAIFVGEYSAEVLGDYTAGPSHVLPTSGAARFSSPLGVADFQIRSSVIHCSPSGAVKLARDAAVLATEEGLTAHAESAGYRVQG